jgi:hypothetical protein
VQWNCASHTGIAGHWAVGSPIGILTSVIPSQRLNPKSLTEE